MAGDYGTALRETPADEVHRIAWHMPMPGGLGAFRGGPTQPRHSDRHSCSLRVAQAYRNIAIALAAAGATFSDVVRLTFYVVDWKPEKMADLMAGIGQVAEELRVVPAPASLIAVAALFEPDVLVEIEATAVLD